MTRKDFEMIAKVIGNERAFTANRECDLAKVDRAWELTARLAVRLADVLGHRNERFDRDRFLTACGLDDVEIAKATKTLGAHRETVLMALLEKEAN